VEAACVSRWHAVYALGLHSNYAASDGTFMAWSVASELGNFDDERPPTTGTVQDNAGGRWGISVDGSNATLAEGAFAEVWFGPLPRKYVGKLSADVLQIVAKLYENDPALSVLTRADANSRTPSLPAAALQESQRKSKMARLKVYCARRKDSALKNLVEAAWRARSGSTALCRTGINTRGSTPPTWSQQSRPSTEEFKIAAKQALAS
jgi:hypothetical protein